jgi:hypothetical protein
MVHKCWLCQFATDTIACNVSALISDNIHTMSLDVIAEQCSSIIAQESANREVSEENAGGYDVDSVKEHILRHMLDANVTLANTLRQLLALNHTLHRQMIKSSTDEGMIDSKQIRDYLAVTNQLACIYRIGEGNRLLFSRPSTQ